VVERLPPQARIFNILTLIKPSRYVQLWLLRAAIHEDVKALDLAYDESCAASARIFRYCGVTMRAIEKFSPEI
jgi:hypothetical protein